MLDIQVLSYSKMMDEILVPQGRKGGGGGLNSSVRKKRMRENLKMKMKKTGR